MVTILCTDGHIPFVHSVQIDRLLGISRLGSLDTNGISVFTIDRSSAMTL
jgi:hypothetical protein